MATDTDPTALTFALAAMRASGPLPTTGGGGAASSVAVTNFPATQPVSAATLPLPAGAATDGTDITTPTAMPAGGSGIRGWLSAIWTKLNGSLAVTGTFWQATQPVSGTFWQATQPVSLATNTPDVTDRTARLLGHVTVDVMPTTTITGTVTSNQGTAALVASAWPVKQTDGTNTAAVKAASTAPVASDGALVVSLSPNTPPAASNPAATWRQFATGAAAAAGTVTQATAGAGVKNYLAGFTFSYTGAALTAGTTVQVKDGATVIYEEYVPQSAATAGAVNRTFIAPLAGTANTAMTVNASAGVTSVTQKVAAWGYTGP